VKKFRHRWGAEYIGEEVSGYEIINCDKILQILPY